MQCTSLKSEQIRHADPVKKPTRQWAAWTRQEEENFFNALRQVGKNFEKITLRVQSKNKDQVRHYYYRLVRRMKKLLGPGFSLDAKNSKDTIAAMLRWWSLLEKFSCSASKLHLKPRRFKIFVEALGNQLQKDRNKTRKKCAQGDMYISSSPILSKTQGNESFPVKLLSVDVQNGSKIATAKGAFFKRVVEPNSNYKAGAIKGDLSATRTVKQKRRSGGVVASAAYKKWERAAMAGVSLVADAAEQLERNAVDQSLCNVDARAFGSSSNNLPTVNGISTNEIKEADLQAPAKLKLQLFPINEATRKALEKDEHNPHLELTLSARKKISSVLEHLNRKWGNSNIASGELMLFPYSAHQEDLATYQRWTIKDTVAVADVFLSVNSPSVFRLRYGWFSLAELEAGVSEISLTHFENCMIPEDIQINTSLRDKAHVKKDGTLLSNCISGQLSNNPNDQSILAMLSTTGKDVGLPEQSINASLSQFDRQKQERVLANQTAEANLGNCAAISEGEWADTLTNISVGYLLAEASRGANSDCLEPSVEKTALYLENPCSYDSFDAAIALHVSHYKAADQSCHASHSTIWGAEETCDEFSFHLAAAQKQERSNTSASSSPESKNEFHPLNSSGFQGFIQELPGGEVADNPCIGDTEDIDVLCENSPPKNDDETELKDQSLADMYWPDSLGPLELEIPSARFQSDDLLFSDSQNSWSRMMASSLDAFRNLSFFAMDKNDSIPSIM